MFFQYVIIAVELWVVIFVGLVIVGEYSIKKVFLNAVGLIVCWIYVCFNYYEKFFRRNQILFSQIFNFFFTCFPPLSGDYYVPEIIKVGLSPSKKFVLFASWCKMLLTSSWKLFLFSRNLSCCHYLLVKQKKRLD